MNVDEELRAVHARGYTILEGLLAEDELAAIRGALAHELARDVAGRNNFEGFATRRVYTLAARGEPFARLATHPRVLALVDRLLEPGYLLTASQAIEIRPGETEQPWHADDVFYSIPRPRPAVSVSTIVAIDAFTRENGATELLPGSHLWGDDDVRRATEHLRGEFRTAPRGERVPKEPVPLGARFEGGDAIAATMPPGSCVVFLGTLFHRGGRNATSSPRLAVSNQYCQPWARQQENFTLAVPPARAATLPPRLRELFGYSIHAPFMGHVGGLHPLRASDVALG